MFVSKIFLNVKNLPCPLPLIKLKKALSSLQKGDLIILEATDRGVLKDIPAFCSQKGLICKILSFDSPYKIKIKVIVL